MGGGLRQSGIKSIAFIYKQKQKGGSMSHPHRSIPSVPSESPLSSHLFPPVTALLKSFVAARDCCQHFIGSLRLFHLHQANPTTTPVGENGPIGLGSYQGCAFLAGPHVWRDPRSFRFKAHYVEGRVRPMGIVPLCSSAGSSLLPASSQTASLGCHHSCVISAPQFIRLHPSEP